MVPWLHGLCLKLEGSNNEVGPQAACFFIPALEERVEMPNPVHNLQDSDSRPFHRVGLVRRLPLSWFNFIAALHLGSSS